MVPINSEEIRLEDQFIPVNDSSMIQSGFSLRYNKITDDTTDMSDSGHPVEVTNI